MPENPNPPDFASLDMTNPQREKQLYFYTVALEKGDWDAVQRVLALAQNDPTLSQMIQEWNDAEVQSLLAVADRDDAALVAQIAQRVFTQPDIDEEVEFAPLTVGNVAGRLEENAARGLTRADRETLEIARRLRQSKVPLPPSLHRPAVAALFQNLNIQAGERFLKQFRDTALMLVMGQQQGRAQMAATRRQNQKQRMDIHSPEVHDNDEYSKDGTSHDND